MTLSAHRNARSAVRHTKVIATLGPASSDPIDELIGAGADVFRRNLAAGSHAEQARRIKAIRHVASAQCRFVAILADLHGPKIRIAGFTGDRRVLLNVGHAFTIDADLDPAGGTPAGVGTCYATLADEVRSGDRVILSKR